MTNAAITVTDVVYRPDDAIHVHYSDGSVNEYADRDDVISQAVDVVSVDLAKRLALAHWLALTPDASSAASLIGKTVEIQIGSLLNPVAIG